MDIRKDFGNSYWGLTMPRYFSVLTKLCRSRRLILLAHIGCCSTFPRLLFSPQILSWFARTEIIYYPEFFGISTNGLSDLFVQHFSDINWTSLVIIIDIPTHFWGLIIIWVTLYEFMITTTIIYYYGSQWTHYYPHNVHLFRDISSRSETSDALTITSSGCYYYHFYQVTNTFIVIKPVYVFSNCSFYRLKNPILRLF